MRKWRWCPVSRKLLPYETIVKAHEGNPEAVEAVLSHYAGYIKYVSMMNGRVNADVEEHVKLKLIESLMKFRFDR
ncbi:helix-turn-helix domain-containing protein [Enterocloster clostridioformis]|uniref:helix-turn-helix domain-containing protein n=1 Tax=Enterocloster clostridioformis TaxID=1531 RepID=UPI00056DD111|nr:helix-turn-helix domain-containing protein [Enterocloster clostridioformis]